MANTYSKRILISFNKNIKIAGSIITLLLKNKLIREFQTNTENGKIKEFIKRKKIP